MMTRRNLAVAAQCLVSVALLVLLFRGLDLEAFRQLFARLPVWFYALSLTVVVAGQTLYAWRWRQLLIAGGVRVSFGSVLEQYFIGVFLNNFFPSTVGGDMAKVYYLGRRHGYRPITASIVLDRLLGIGLLALLATVTQWMVPVPSPRLVAARAVVTFMAIAIMTVFAVAAVGTGGLPRRLARFGDKAVALASRLQRFRLEMAGVMRSPRILLIAAAVVATYFLAITAIYDIFLVLNTSARPTFLVLLTTVATASLLSNLPVSLNGLGLREQLHVVLLQPLGVPREAAVAISLLLFAHLLVTSVGGFILWLRVPVIPADTEQPTGA
jgi:glycosyltransferase 2 family protein